MERQPQSTYPLGSLGRKRAAIVNYVPIALIRVFLMLYGSSLIF